MLFPIFNFKINETGLRPPCFPVQAPVLYGFRQMACLDIRRGFQVGDRTGDFQDAVVGAGGKIEALHGDLQQRQAGSIRHGVFMKQFGGHLGIAVNTLMYGKAFFLDSAGFHHALAYRFATFGRVSVGYLLERDRHDFYLYIDPVEQRAGNTIHVFLDSTRRTETRAIGVIIISARTRIHGSDQHEVGRIINR